MTATRIFLFRAIGQLACASDLGRALPGWLGNIALTRRLFIYCAFATGSVLAASSMHPATAAVANEQANRLGFGQFKHVRWTVDDGAPRNIWRMAQTPDGYLWFSTDEGLVRFDGVNFERIPAPPGSPMAGTAAGALLVRRTGELWVGFSQSGGLAAYRRGRLIDLRLPDPPPGINGMVETLDGAVWLSWGGRQPEDKRLLRFTAGRWENMAARLGLPPGMVGRPVVTPDGTLWLTLESDAGSSLWFLPRGNARLQRSATRVVGRPGIAVDRRGGLWLTDAAGTRQLFDARGAPVAAARVLPAVAGPFFNGLAFDTKGGLWGTAPGGGIYNIPVPTAERFGVEPKLHLYSAKDGLTSNETETVFVDREGSIWAAGAAGLDQFRRAEVRLELPITANFSEGLMLATSSSGSVYAVTGKGLFAVKPGGAPYSISARTPVAICRAFAGGIWAIGTGEAIRIDHGNTLEKIAMPKAIDPVGTCTDTRDGLWLRLVSMGLVHHDGRGWRTVTDAADASQRRDHWDLVTPGWGGVAFRQGNDLASIRGDTIRVTPLGAADLAPLSMIGTGPRDILVGANRGLLRVRGGVVSRIEAARVPWIGRLRGVAQGLRGDTWFIGGDGVSLVASASLDSAFADVRAPLPRRLFDARDGLSGGMHPWAFGGPPAVVGGDGRLWILTTTGVSVIDPGSIRKNLLPPGVVIRAVTAGARVYRDPLALTLPPGTRSIGIDYAALSFVIPQRIRFRYHLEGVDDRWVDPGTRRSADYSNLGPGRYEFRVIAANSDGVWNRTGATLSFEILPTFFESWPFRLLCGVALLGLLWLAYALRLRAVTGQMRSRMNERTAERARIARELHDTLLQSVQALTLRFQLAIDYLPKDEPARPVLEAAIDQADQLIAEGRDRVRDLRTFEESDIEKVLCDIVARQAFAADVEMSVTSSGTVRPLDPLAFDEIVRITNEAIFNVRRHANATKLVVEIGYGRTFTIKVADNGVGIDPGILSRGSRKDHYGLPGMRERARKLRGDLTMHQGVDGGTELLLTIPGRIAYKDGKFGLFARFRTRE